MRHALAEVLHLAFIDSTRVFDCDRLNTASMLNDTADQHTVSAVPNCEEWKLLAANTMGTILPALRDACSIQL
jgi:hypothetical protein